MTDERELRAASDKMVALLEQVGQLEGAKRTFEVGSEPFVKTAEEVERLARLVFRWSQLQLQLARATTTERTTARLVDIAPRPLDKILADWREAQLRLEAARPGSDEAQAAADDVERLREEFRANQEALR